MKMKNRRINVHIYNRTYRYMLTDEAKSKPKKKGGFQAKLETMMKEQQRIQQEKAKNKK